VAGLRASGLIARFVLDRPRGKVFRADVEQFLALALAPGDVVVMDILSAHKVAGIARPGLRERENRCTIRAITVGLPCGRGTGRKQMEPNDLDGAMGLGAALVIALVLWLVIAFAFFALSHIR